MEAATTKQTFFCSTCGSKLLQDVAGERLSNCWEETPSEGSTTRPPTATSRATIASAMSALRGLAQQVEPLDMPDLGDSAPSSPSGPGSTGPGRPGAESHLAGAAGLSLHDEVPVNGDHRRHVAPKRRQAAPQSLSALPPRPRSGHR